ncbi:MAG: hypothetical protein JXB88_00270 [Spirochaetales bacterium]|nr:hypothetical protein [Spirochaetales bacterium]
MTYMQKDVLLIDDTFVSNLLAKKHKNNNSDTIDISMRQFLPGIGFEDSFFNVLRVDFQQNDLADTIETLLSNSINPAGLHLSSILEKEGFSYDTINCSLSQRKRLVDFLKNIKYKLIGISTTFTLGKQYIYDLMDFLSEIFFYYQEF